MEAYQGLLEDVLKNGHHKSDRTGTGTIGVFGRQIRFSLKDKVLPVVTTKKVHLKSVIHELLWFISGSTNIQYLEDNGVTIWNEWADENGDLGPVYGKQWRSWEFARADGWYTVDQLANAINQLKTNPDSRRIMVSAWNPSEIDEMALPPCHYGFQFNTRPLSLKERLKIAGHPAVWPGCENSLENISIQTAALDLGSVPKYELSLMWNQRSVDCFLGLPFNITSYGLLCHMVAQVVNMVPGELVGSFGDTHIYSNHVEQVKEQLTRIPKDQPRVALNGLITNIDDFKYEDIVVTGYDPHPHIAGKVAV